MDEFVRGTRVKWYLVWDKSYRFRLPRQTDQFSEPWAMAWRSVHSRRRQIDCNFLQEALPSDWTLYLTVAMGQSRNNTEIYHHPVCREIKRIAQGWWRGFTTVCAPANYIAAMSLQRIKSLGGDIIWRYWLHLTISRYSWTMNGEYRLEQTDLKVSVHRAWLLAFLKPDRLN